MTHLMFKKRLVSHLGPLGAEHFGLKAVFHLERTKEVHTLQCLVEGSHSHDLDPPTPPGA